MQIIVITDHEKISMVFKANRLFMRSERDFAGDI